jgi:hypothetical protein
LAPRTDSPPHRGGQVHLVLAAAGGTLHAVPARHPGGDPRVSAGQGAAPRHHQADAPLVRQHAPGQLAGDCARTPADRPVCVVVSDRSAFVDVDPAARSGGRGAVRAEQNRRSSSTPICSGSP